MIEDNALNHKKIIVDDELYFVVEGDILLDIDEYDLYIQSKEAEKKILDLRRSLKSKFISSAMSDINSRNDKLIAMTVNDKIIRWHPNTVLTYCVLKNTFSNTKQYEQVAENMKKATKDWESICGVKFEYKNILDNSSLSALDGVVFPVRFLNSSGAYIAAAFFPIESPARRKLLIDPSYFSTDFDKIGILRHELGHILGFNHEHIHSSAPAICPDEETSGTISLTNYDPSSVMHYFCGSVGNKLLALTEIDRQGAQRLYGLPLNNFENIIV